MSSTFREADSFWRMTYFVEDTRSYRKGPSPLQRLPVVEDSWGLWTWDDLFPLMQIFLKHHPTSKGLQLILIWLSCESVLKCPKTILRSTLVEDKRTKQKERRSERERERERKACTKDWKNKKIDRKWEWKNERMNKKEWKKKRKTKVDFLFLLGTLRLLSPGSMPKAMEGGRSVTKMRNKILRGSVFAAQILKDFANYLVFLWETMFTSEG